MYQPHTNQSITNHNTNHIDHITNLIQTMLPTTHCLYYKETHNQIPGDAAGDLMKHLSTFLGDPNHYKIYKCCSTSTQTMPPSLSTSVHSIPFPPCSTAWGSRTCCWVPWCSIVPRPDLMVKKLRFYARFIVVSLLLNKMELVKQLIQARTHISVISNISF